MTLRTSYEFTLPRGYVDGSGQLHRTGTMRLATARDELEPLRDPMVSGPDDPRLTILVLTRVIEKLGTLEMVTPYEIEGLFAVDLAFLQDFYGVINFGNQAEYDALMRAQEESDLLGSPAPASASGPVAPAAAPETPGDGSAGPPAETPVPRTGMRSAIEELPRRSL
ncbi:hypothetical protein P5P86_19380 [Nocardioides sp. BP30]|uniref:hypothetical protein n=1 Tax=Nocardioides sp. BP30 TaxID=3036374 RepID=UPI002468E00E|nr:hypothetical protein [Nocardioides sp. BP30]WGL52100.1 hypothetical protein P5P86_19380 [Nocardioides sp. BP30]